MSKIDEDDVLGFQIGDIVELKLGGLKMIVEHVNDQDDLFEICCVWFSGTKLQTKCFNPAMLVKAEESDKPIRLVEIVRDE